jgi:hypothetical protein
VVGAGDLLPHAAGPPQRAPAPGAVGLRPLATQIPQGSLFDHDSWANLEGHTEAAWARRALAGDWPTWRRHDGQVLELVCRPNLDLHTGVAGWYRHRHGNLRTDGPQAVLGRALAQGGRSADALWFDLAPLPSVAGLAARRGDPHGQAVHFSADSVRYLWLDRAQRAPRAATLDSSEQPPRSPG